MKMDMTTSTGSSMPMSTSSSSAMDMEQMNMVFFTSTTTLLWTKSFAPETTGQYAGVCIFLIAFATILRMLLALRVNFYSIRDGLRRRRTKGLRVESRGSETSNRPWRANEAMMLGAIDVLIAGVSYLLHITPISLLSSAHLQHLIPLKMSNATADPVGSTSWIGADAYDPGDELHGRALAVLDKLNWDHLLSLSSALNNGVPCTFSQKFSIGHFNMVRRIDFTDGTSWVARVRLLEFRTVFGDREVPDVASALKVEVSSMKFFKTKTSIPVPVVHSYSVDTDTEVGAPYVLMDYIHGTVATELRDANEYEAGLFGTPDQDRAFRNQMAEIQATLSSFKFSQIRSLYQDKETSDFFIGPETETGKGPWSSSLEYYEDISNHALQVCVQHASPDVNTASSFANPILFRHLMSLYRQQNPCKESFSLVNRDFGAHNLLVNEEFQIVGVIDFDGVMAAPIEVVAQYPVLTGLSREPPGCVETRPAAIERIERTKPKLMEYKEMLAAAERKLRKDDEGATPIADLLLSDAASVFQGLVRYQVHQVFVNDQWMEAYLKLIRDHFQKDGSVAE
ncbi:kinase-like domain protein [Fusarium tjaetaba]|uniref:Kinase-like domain protein n=1 Tax=Fusarium tjaetaba TaxID=1567544 RepID=A0A8H5R748_9HYPO|nr:kinase-like domain protein [Fusarium tjaetaba]KAF5627809.1 kinase-like domain protein [Fusarium tjaetaba]